MSRNTRPIVFDSGESSDSGNDSIATDSTAESAQLDVYPVDKILAETGVPGEDVQYLIKWEGYPLARATWEPVENVTSKNVLSTWEQQKRLVEEGKAEAFDPFAWYEAKAQYEQQKLERHERRKVKRRKRGLPESPNRVDDGEGREAKEGDAYDEENDDQGRPSSNSYARQDSAQRPTRKPAGKDSSTATRKGIARRISKRPRIESTSGSSSEDEPILGRRPRPQVSKVVPEWTSTSRAAPSKKSNSDRDTRSRRSTSTSEPLQNLSRGAEPAKPVRVAARKSAPGGAHAPLVATRDVLANWDAPKTKRQRPRVSGDTPKDSMDPKFTRLSTQRRMQLYSRNENAPDINALPIVDLKTGKVIRPKAKETPAAYLRRSPPPPPRSSPPPERLTGPNDGERHRQSSGVGIQDSSRTTCYYWLKKGGCAFGLSCKFAHEDTGRYEAPPDGTGRRRLDARFDSTLKDNALVPSDQVRRYDANGNLIPMLNGVDWPDKRETTCFFWHHSTCRLPDNACEFAHYDTGKYAEPPPGFKRPSAPDESRRVEASNSNVDSAHVVEMQRNDTHRPSLPHRESAMRAGRKDITCVFWQNGRCRHSDRECDFAHHDTGVYADSRPALPKETTCYYWWSSKCDKEDHECKFAHRDTGVYAGPPGSYRKSGQVQMVPVGPWESAAGMKSISEALGEPINAPMEPPTARQGSGSWAAAQTSNQPRDVRATRPMDFVASPVNMLDAPAQSASEPSAISGTRVPSALGRPSMTAETLIAGFVVSCAGDDQPLQLQARLETYDIVRLKTIVGAGPGLELDRMVLAADFERLVFNQTRGFDEVIAFGGVSLANRKLAQDLSDLCKNNASGFIASVNGLSAKLLIYPSAVEGWKFLDGPGMKSDGDFNFRIFKSLPGTETALPNIEDNRLPAVAIGEDLAKLTTDTLVNRNGAREVKAVFLTLPPTRRAELEVYSAYFTALDIKVYHSGMPGAWAWFRTTHTGKGGLVLIHADVTIWKIVGLHSFLQYGSRVFRVGGRIDDDDAGLFCERLFPIGTAVFITDDLFAHYPEEATIIIRSFLHENKRKPDGGEFNRIVTRPGVKVWLERLAEDSQQHGKGDSRWVKLYEQICRLCPSEDEDPDDLPNPSLDSWLVSIAPELLPTFNGLWDKDPEKATEFMVNWFAGWSIENANKFRKFHIAYKPRNKITKTVVDVSGRRVDQEVLDPKGWGDKYQHLAVRPAIDVFSSSNKKTAR